MSPILCFGVKFQALKCYIKVCLFLSLYFPFLFYMCVWMNTCVFLHMLSMALPLNYTSHPFLSQLRSYHLLLPDSLSFLCIWVVQVLDLYRITSICHQLFLGFLGKKQWRGWARMRSLFLPDSCSCEPLIHRTSP